MGALRRLPAAACTAAAAAAAAAARAAGGAAAAEQQAAGRQQPLFQQLLTSMARRHYAAAAPQQQQQQAFQPSRLYPAPRQGGEAAAFWGLVGLNAGLAFLAKSDQPDVRQLVRRHFRASVEAVADGRPHTLLSSTLCHTSLVHCGINLLLLVLYRRTQPLSAKELLGLYFLGGLAASCTHVAWSWWDAGGPEFGLRYAVNTPGLYGCSGSVAAILAYKAMLQPLGVPHVGLPLPLPIVAVAALFCCLYVREEDYSDYAGKFGGAALGALAALAAVAAGRRRFAWRS